MIIATLLILIFILISNLLGIILNYYLILSEIEEYKRINYHEAFSIHYNMNHWLTVFITKCVYYNESDFFKYKEYYFLLEKYRINKIL